MHGETCVAERLEPRFLLAASVENGVLTITGTDSDDFIYVRQVGQVLRVERLSVNWTSDWDARPEEVHTFSVGKGVGEVSRIVVRTGAGNDLINLHMARRAKKHDPHRQERLALAGTTYVRARLFAGSGDDEVAGGSGNDVIRGGSGNDRVGGGPGDDRIKGNSGSDNLGGEEGDDILFGGSGDDELSAHVGRDTLFGGRGADSISGGSSGPWREGDVIGGGAGADELYLDDLDELLEPYDPFDVRWYDEP